MDAAIRWLGAHYHLVLTWGPLVLAAGVILVVVAVLGVRRRSRGVRFVVPAVVVAVELAGAAAYTLVRRNSASLVVPAGYDASEVAIVHGAITLTGSVLTPREGVRHPGAVFIAGSDISSYRTNYAPLVNEVLTPALAQRGYAIVYLDKRGVGRSTGDWQIVNLDTLANDAWRGVEWLRANPHIDPSRIVVIGHSQGGWVAQRVAALHPEVAAVASLAGPAVSVREQIADDEFMGHRCGGADSSVAHERTQALMADLDRQSETATGGRLRHYALIRGYDPAETLRAIRQPALFVFGQHDQLVYWPKNTERLLAALGGKVPLNVTVLEVPGAGHSLRLAEPCHSGSVRRLPWAPAFRDGLLRWLDTLR